MKKPEIYGAWVILLALSLVAAGCIAWTEDPNGNLHSIGLPGVPVWTAKQPSTQAPLPPAQSAAAEISADETAGSPWLDELNSWRRAAGLQAVAENLQLSDGSREHAHYLLENARGGGTSVVAYGMAMGSAMHSESPGSVGYSDEGAQAAVGGRHVYGIMQTAVVAWGQLNQKGDIDSLLEVPFHRLSLLAPWAEVAGYGKAGKPPDRVAAVALRGRQGRDANIVVRFPPAGTTVPFGAMTASEWPNPLTACSGYALPVGLPITLQLVTPFNIASYSITDLTTGKELEACAFDALTYENPDATQQAHARRALSAAKAIVLVPRSPLVAGHQCQVTVQAGTEYKWTFNVAATADQTAAQKTAPPAF